MLAVDDDWKLGIRSIQTKKTKSYLAMKKIDPVMKSSEII